VRKLPSVIAGALMLSFGLAPTTAFAADTIPDPAGTSAVTAQEPTPTDTPTPTPTPTETTTPPDDGEGDYLPGQFVLTPLSGKPGSTFTVTSKTPCVDSDGKVGPQAEVVAIDEAALDDDDAYPTFDKILATDSSGGWTTTAKVPATAKTGDIYFVIAACFEAGPIGDETEPFLVYDFQEFTVTPADKAPVATPVPGNPDFTG
jgi:hypothetical protein